MIPSDKITLAHGNGGQLMQKLISSMILSSFGNPILNRLDDSAVLDLCGDKGRLAFSTDSFVVNPIFFPGGDIGKLAVCGTVNDLAMVGAQPLYLSASVIMEEGFALRELEQIIASMRKTLREAGVRIVCGDTKVVNKGHCDKIFLNTAGIGMIRHKSRIAADNAAAGDLIIVSGTIGEHGMAVLGSREGLQFHRPLKSDCAPLNKLVQGMLKLPNAVHAMRDPTRGGVATALNEIAQASGIGIEIDEESLPVSAAVGGAAEILGLDPLYLPCEGRLLAFVDPKKAERLLAVIRAHKYGRQARIIGRAVAAHKKEVYLNTLTGGQRILDIPVHDQMPRIC